jgi:predicted site-specific integrase-resolvase
VTEPDEARLRSSEAAKYFKVDPRTLWRWADAGLIKCEWTGGQPGKGHRRYYESEMVALTGGLQPLLTPGEMASLFNVAPRSPGRWALEGRIKGVFQTPSTNGKGNWRFPEAEVRRFLNGAE